MAGPRTADQVPCDDVGGRRRRWIQLPVRRSSGYADDCPWPFTSGRNPRSRWVDDLKNTFCLASDGLRRAVGTRFGDMEDPPETLPVDARTGQLAVDNGVRTGVIVAEPASGLSEFG